MNNQSNMGAQREHEKSPETKFKGMEDFVLNLKIQLGRMST